MTPCGLARSALLTALATAVAGDVRGGAANRHGTLRPATTFEDRVTAERAIVIVRLDPKTGARPGECDDLAMADLAAASGPLPLKVVSVERVPRPERHWLLLDVSESAEASRREATRSALQYVQQVMHSGDDVAALVTVDEDPILVAGPTADPSELARTIDDVGPGGWSALRDGLDTVLRQVQGDRHEHVVLFWTDGEDQASLLRADDLLATLSRVPNATVFPIALLPRGAKFPPPPLAGATFAEVARRSGGEVFVSSDPRWLDRVRGWLGRRFVISLAPPTGGEADGPSPWRPSITVPTKRCSVTLLPDPFARPDPVAGEAPPAPQGWANLHDRARRADDPECRPVGGKASWNWPLNADATGLSGCVLDMMQASGPIVRERNGSLDYRFQSPRFAARQIRVVAPPFSELPADPADAIESIVSPDDIGGWRPSPYFMDGGAFLAQRAQIATSLFASRTDYHDFAVARLARHSREELRAIERDFARAFPNLSPDEIAAVARASRAGARSVDSATTPTDSDLARVLAAWIADLPAAELLQRVEARQIDERLQGASVSESEARWAAVRSRFAVPSRVRIAAPLALIHDRSQDVVGFVRIVLPRPEGFRARDPRPPSEPPRGNDRIVRRPLALGLVDTLAADPTIGAALATRGYRAAVIGYDDLPPTRKPDEAEPYELARVTIRLEAPAGPGQAGPSVVLDADVSAPMEGAVVVDELTATVTGDRELATLLNRYRATRQPRTRPSRGLCCGRRRGSCRARVERG